MPKSSSDPLDQAVIAERSFKLGRRVLIATIHKPVRVRTSPVEWVAAFKVEGVGDVCTGRAIGIDSLQALLLAVQVLRARMEELGLDFTWLDGEPRATGIPPAIPTSFGLGFTKRAQTAVLRELRKYVRSAEGRKERREERRRLAARAAKKRRPKKKSST